MTFGRRTHHEQKEGLYYVLVAQKNYTTEDANTA
jgi:hypothetical protein